MYGIHQEMAREHQTELLRSAERYRLARQARGERTARLSALLTHIRRRRLRQPVPAV